MSELRWHPIHRQWVITATDRQARTFLPPRDYCPLCPTTPGGFASEIPVDSYHIAVFENKFPSLREHPSHVAVAPTALSPVEPAVGACEVIVYTPQHDATFASLSIAQIQRLIAVWTDRYQQLGARNDVKYVFIFENKGEVIGVTLHHPHGQIYAFPFVPPVPQSELDAAEEHFASTGRCLFCDILQQELDDGRRVVAANQRFVAFIPFFARWPYEVYVMPRRHVADLTGLAADDRRALAEILKDVTQGYDTLFDRSLPYMMVLHQQPTDQKAYPHYHFHIEFYPPNRSATKLKFLAGVETGCGSWINDTLAEEKADELRTAIGQASGLAY